jgi:hypothetical protein
MNLRDYIRQMVRMETQPELFAGTVKSVNTTDCTCHVLPIDGSADMPDVKLRGVNDGADFGAVLFPKVGANVVVAKLMGNYNNTVMLMCDSFESVQIKQQNGITINVDAFGNIELNGGQFGGLVKVGQLVSRLNAIEQALNSIKGAFTAWVPALKIAITPYLSPISQTTVSSIENPKVKH